MFGCVLKGPIRLKALWVIISNCFPDTRIVQIAKSPNISPFFNVDDSSLGCHVNAVSYKRLEIQAKTITKTNKPFEIKICQKNTSF